MRSAAACIACIALLGLASSAQAAQRYASPTGAGVECTQAVPCSLAEALIKAKANDEVIIGGGAYNLVGSVFLSGEATGADVHGDFSGPPPTISASVPGGAVNIFTPKSRLSYVDVTNFGESGYSIGCGLEVTVERSFATAKSKNGNGLFNAGGCTVRSSVIRAVGDEAVGLLANCSTLAIGRNLTVVASGEKAVGVLVNSNGGAGSPCTLDLKNAIVSGSLFDIRTSMGSFSPGNVVVEHSNFDVAKQEPGTTITQGAGNQTAPPLFKDAANFDYHEVGGSPTIDAGVNDQIGTLDLDGKARLIGSAPDIGAFEFVPPPPAPSAAAGQIQSLSLAPSAFLPSGTGEAILSAKKKPKGPVGTRVAYSLSAAATVTFTIERKLVGRRLGKKCAKPTKANRSKAKCSTLKPLSGNFTAAGASGENSFRFSGRLAGRALAPGSYELVGAAGGASRRAAFKIAG